MDINRDALPYAKKKEFSQCEFIIADAQQLPFRDQTIDKIICADIIEHLDRPEQLIAESQRVLRENGSIVISTPNENPIWRLDEFLWDAFGRGRDY